TTVGVSAVLVVLHAFEVRKNILVSPAARPKPFPVIEIACRTTQEDEAIYGARASDDLAPRPIDASAIELWLGLRLVTPVQTGIDHHPAEPHGDMDPRMPVPATGFDEAKRDRWIFRDPGRHHAAGRATADYDNIVLSIGRCGTVHVYYS